MALTAVIAMGQILTVDSFLDDKLYNMILSNPTINIINQQIKLLTIFNCRARGMQDLSKDHKWPTSNTLDTPGIDDIS